MANVMSLNGLIYDDKRARTVYVAFSSRLSLSITTIGSVEPMFKLRSTLRETRPVDLISTELPRG